MMYSDGAFQPQLKATEGRASLKDYLAIARFDHVTKHVFILPGIILAYALRAPSLDHAAVSIMIGFGSAIAIASANYVINEWLDREYDAFHPVKSARRSVHRNLSPAIVYTEYIVLALIGIGLASRLGTTFFGTSFAFIVFGLIYNVAPVRTKDRAYLDVLSESLNNPIRLTLGRAMVDPGALPPSSLLLAHWSGGAFLMAAKRLSEYRDISTGSGTALLHRYRRSFAHYTAESLTVSCLLYAMLSVFFIAAFLIKYRQEYVIALPFIAALFAMYFWLSLLSNSIAQRPERLFRSRGLVVVSVIVIVVLLVLTFVNLLALDYLSTPSFVAVK